MFGRNPIKSDPFYRALARAKRLLRKDPALLARDTKFIDKLNRLAKEAGFDKPVITVTKIEQAHADDMKP